MNRITATLTAAALLTLAGCGSSSNTTRTAAATSPAAAPAVTTTAGPTPTPTPTTLTVAQAAARYQQLVKPSNAIVFGEYKHAVDAYQAAQSDTTRAALATAAAHLAAADRIQVTGFRNTAWPPSVQGPINDLIKVNASDIAATRALAAAKTDADVAAAFEMFDDQAAGQAAELVREALGLPPAPTS